MNKIKYLIFTFVLFFALSFNVKANSISSIKVKCKDGTLPTLPTPVKDGYNFVSWKYKGGSKYVEGTEIVKCDSFTVYATWEKDPNKYIITLCHG